MSIDEERLVALIQERGKVVVSATYDGGAPGFTGNAEVIRFGGLFWACNDNDGLSGPYESLRDALGEEHLAFGEVDVSVDVTGMAPSTYAKLMTVDAPEGHTVTICEEDWVVGEDGELVRTGPPRRKKKKAKRRRR